MLGHKKEGKSTTMPTLPEQRREQILAWLKDHEILRVDELAQRLNVSLMTIHRDLDALVELQFVEKVHGAVRLLDPYKFTVDACHLCQVPIKPRLQFMITLSNGKNLQACCAHCGVMMLNLHADVQMALLRDFIYGKMVNVFQAYFVIQSRVSVCCEPSTLAFVSYQDAQDFQKGFGGQVLDFIETRQLLNHLHQSHSSHPQE